MKECPFCAEEIQDEAVKCRYCGSDLSTQPCSFCGKPVLGAPEKCPECGGLFSPATPPPPAPPPDIEINPFVGMLVVVGLIGGIWYGAIWWSDYKSTHPSTSRPRSTAISGSRSRQPKQKPTPNLAELQKADAVVAQARTAGMISKIDERAIWVEPLEWFALTYDQKQGLTYAAAIHSCRCTDANHFSIRVLNKMNGKQLARWGILGFKVD